MPDLWSAENYTKNASFVYSDKFTSPTLELLALRDGEHILDLGCGHGVITKQLALQNPHGSVLGTDISHSMIGEATKNIHEPNLEFRVQDAHDVGLLPSNSFDAVYTNATIHWLKADPQKVCDGVFRSLTPGGRYAGEGGGFMNLVGLVSTLEQVLVEQGMSQKQVQERNPWVFHSDSSFKTLLEKSGFDVKSCELVPRITRLNDKGIVGWLDTFAFDYFQGMSSEKADLIKQTVQERLKIDLFDGQHWSLMYVRLRFLAVKPSG